MPASFVHRNTRHILTDLQLLKQNLFKESSLLPSSQQVRFVGSPITPSTDSMNVTVGDSIWTDDLLSPSSSGGLVSQLQSASGWVALSGAALLGLAAIEQVRFHWLRKGSSGKSDPLPGPDYVVPFIGGIVEMIKDPTGFWDRQRLYQPTGLSWNSIVGKFTVFVTDPVISRHVFNHNGSDSLLLELHPSGKRILGKNNIAYMHGPSHKQLRKSFLALFTRRALALYVLKQDAIVTQHVMEWLRDGRTAKEIRPFVRDLNAFTSQEVFAGPYLDDPAEREEFGKSYMAMTEAFLCAPIFFPGTGVWKGWKGRLFVIKVLTKAVKRSKERMRAGVEPDCLLDFWSLQVLQEMDEAAANGQPPPFYHSDHRMADSVMDFLFASQDASTASLVWMLTQMAEHPDILERVRAEQMAVRPNLDAPISGEQLNEMPFTRQVVKEVLRFRPPAPMVPQTAQADFKITDTFTAPKGTLIVPSLIAASLHGYENAETFDPDRFGPERKEDVKFAGNFLVFGHGPHYCVGKEYAQNHLAVFLARISTSMNWERQRSKQSDEMIYLPTIYPGDSVFTFSKFEDGSTTGSSSAADLSCAGSEE